MVKMAPKISILCGRYQFLGFYVKYHSKIGILISRIPKSQSVKMAIGLMLHRACQDEFDDVKIVEI